MSAMTIAVAVTRDTARGDAPGTVESAINEFHTPVAALHGAAR
jgi:hypothetical protein